ncbi:MAG: hypothetical protein WC654_02680 [Patescibacteria group bacterium]
MDHEPTLMSPDHALAELAMIESALHATGAVDVETPALAQVRRDLLSGKMDPKEAIIKARKIVEGRYDYH